MQGTLHASVLPSKLLILLACYAQCADGLSSIEKYRPKLDTLKLEIDGRDARFQLL